MADWTGVVSAVIAAIGLGFVIVQLRGATAASRAQATIQFQAAFVRSQEARSRLQMSFPIHVSVLEQLAPQARHGDFRTWNDLDDLTAEEKRDARIVVGAMNDVAQYVVDGLALRSALQQYHTIFVRVGMLLLPYLERENAPVEGRPQARWLPDRQPLQRQHLLPSTPSQAPGARTRPGPPSGSRGGRGSARIAAYRRQRGK